MVFHTLRVAETRQESKTAISVLFDIPEALGDMFKWRPGQHLTLELSIDNQVVRRCYSISSSPHSGLLRITVKRVKDGLVSNYINDYVKAGDSIKVMAPFGSFCLDPAETARRSHYFFGAGSGITPLFSMMSSVLEAEHHSDVYLLYGNSNANSILFREDLLKLTEQYPNRFVVCHILSKPSLWSGFSPWRSGRIDADTVHAFINENPPYAQDAQYYLCGPGDMNSTVKTALQAIDVPAERIHSENYSGTAESNETFQGIAAQAKITLDDQIHHITLEPGQTVLEALLAAGINSPYSCQSGVCGACQAHLINGETHMRSRMALEDSDIAQGLILTCQAVAKTKHLEVSFTTG